MTPPIGNDFWVLSLNGTCSKSQRVGGIMTPPYERQVLGLTAYYEWRVHEISFYKGILMWHFSIYCHYDCLCALEECGL